ncbi:MAG: GNAT family protein [Balneolaceae bacterium]
MKVQPFDQRWTAIVAGWLNEEENWKWLQYGSNTKKLDPLTFRVMTQNPEHDFLLFFNESQRQPIGLVSFSEIDQAAKTARIWFILGDKKYTGQGYTKRAVNECLRYAFLDLGLQSVYARTVSENKSSVEILEKNKFNYIGRRRQCHPIDGELNDQLLYDIVSVEFLETDLRKYENVFRVAKKNHKKRISTSVIT